MKANTVLVTGSSGMIVSEAVEYVDRHRHEVLLGQQDAPLRSCGGCAR